MAYRASVSQIRMSVRAELSRIQSRARHAVQNNQCRLEQRIRTMTGNGTRPLSRAQLDQLAREGADYLRNRLK